MVLVFKKKIIDSLNKNNNNGVWIYNIHKSKIYHKSTKIGRREMGVHITKFLNFKGMVKYYLRTDYDVEDIY